MTTKAVAAWRQRSWEFAVGGVVVEPVAHRNRVDRFELWRMFDATRYGQSRPLDGSGERHRDDLLRRPGAPHPASEAFTHSGPLERVIARRSRRRFSTGTRALLG